MDKRITEFEKEQRIALARIVSDLIMADKIIDSEEVKKFAELFDGFNSKSKIPIKSRILSGPDNNANGFVAL